MRNQLLLLFVLLFGKSLSAQTISIDKEKLLEYYQSQRYAEAAQYLQSIYPSDTQDAKALTQMAYCNMMSGRLPDAEKNYLQLNAIQPNTIPVLFSLTNINTRRGNNAKAKGYLAQIISIDSTNFNAYKQLAGLTDSAELKLAYLKKANSLNATDADIAYDLAIAYRNLKFYELGYNVLKIAIAADTGNLILQQTQLPLANQLGKYKEVVSVGLKLLQNDADVNVMKDVGKAYFFLKDYQKCLSFYKPLEDLGAVNESIVYYMTLCYRELKNYDMAVLYAKKTIDEGISTNTAAYYGTLAGIYEEKKQFANATAAYKRGLTFGASNTIYYRMGLMYDLNLKQAKTALTYYNLYLKGKPDPEKDKEQIVYVKARIEALNGPKEAATK